jgi:Family of unknown function (DUF6352)
LKLAQELKVLEHIDTFLRDMLASPQLTLVAESCASEVNLHKALQASPLQKISDAELATIQDSDARDNYAFYLRLQTELLAAGSLEAYYLQLVRSPAVTVPQDVMDALVENITLRMMDATTNPTVDKNIAVQYAAAEWLYKRQAVHLEDGRVMHDVPRDSITEPLDLSHGMANELSHGLIFRLSNANSGLKALSQVLEKWTHHMLKIEVNIKHVAKVDDPAWRWHIGLEATSTGLLNDLYTGADVSEERLKSLVSLFKLEFKNASDMRIDVAGKPVYLGLAMDATGHVKIKPQNLLLNLPIAEGSVL